MDAKKRIYYFDGKSILLDTYDEKNFDQIFEDSKNPKFGSSQVDSPIKDKVISDRSMSKLQGNNNNSIDNLKESNAENISPKLLSKESLLVLGTDLKKSFLSLKIIIIRQKDILKIDQRYYLNSLLSLKLLKR